MLWLWQAKELSPKEVQMRRILSGILLMVMMSALSVSAVFADAPEKTDGFVCPVLGGQAGEDHGNSNNEVIVPIGEGDFTVVGPSVSVPIFATNDEGGGTPPGPHDSPGDQGYTAIWAGQ
jgi:hypothetical protein